MNLWVHWFSLNANQKLQGFLPYQTNKDDSQKTAYTNQKITQNSATILVCFVGQESGIFLAGIWEKRYDDLINSFWI